MVFSDLQDIQVLQKHNLLIICTDIHNYEADADEV